MPEPVPGIHHVTAITADVQRCVDFYVTVLGLRLIKQTVNFDVPDTYHIYFGDRVGSPGTAMTFFGWPHLPRRQAGSGQVTTVAFAVPPASIESWSRRFRDLGVGTTRSERFGAEVIGLRDPDQVQLELVGAAKDGRWQAWAGSPVAAGQQVRGFHGVSLTVAEEEPSAAFLTGVMGFRETGRDAGQIRFETGAGGPGAVLELTVDPHRERGQEATGTVHHVAWRALDDEHELAWRGALLGAGRDVTPLIDRKYFRSIYFREPGGVLFEVATDGPGFAVDEPLESLGSGLQLPAWQEGRRKDLKVNLPPIAVPVTAGPGTRA